MKSSEISNLPYWSNNSTRRIVNQRIHSNQPLDPILIPIGIHYFSTAPPLIRFNSLVDFTVILEDSLLQSTPLMIQYSSDSVCSFRGNSPHHTGVHNKHDNDASSYDDVSRRTTIGSSVWAAPPSLWEASMFHSPHTPTFLFFRIVATHTDTTAITTMTATLAPAM